MYSRNSFGSYYPINSLMHRLNPVIKLINFLIVVVLSIICNSIYINGFILVLIIIMMLLSYVPIKYYINTIWSMRYIYILIAFICAYFNQSLNECLTYIMKLIIIVEYLNILSYTTSPSESIYGIEKFLSIFNILYLPVSKLAMKINSMLRFIPLLLTVEYKTLKASSSRGIDYYHANIIGRFIAITKTYKNIIRLVKLKSKEIFYSQELRLYNHRKYRTNYRTNKVGFNDIFFLLFHLSLFYAYLVEGGLI